MCVCVWRGGGISSVGVGGSSVCVLTLLLPV